MSRPRFWDPTGERFGIPTYPWRLAPDGLKTRRQLRACGLRPGGQPVAAQVLWRSRRSTTPRGTYSSTAYVVTVASHTQAVAADDAARVRWVPVADLIRDTNGLAFDHAQIIADALRATGDLRA
ncbi:hypothetical protein Kpho02_07460 [Kitasatospora phosalacinea]|uniref:Nudix hydrolase domain-containing protein n=1 Tax=Kitasatospora phosalacinea TaxID=2065 RepID=A0A9W6V0P3_9ACTN|nr:hypothetical protein [Kitasatospora phosalacinea]GLW68447.1 hypothetical protein Kpho02_07460 [Kitasatospora phosalacinea]